MPSPETEGEKLFRMQKELISSWIHDPDHPADETCRSALELYVQLNDSEFAYVSELQWLPRRVLRGPTRTRVGPVFLNVKLAMFWIPIIKINLAKRFHDEFCVRKSISLNFVDAYYRIYNGRSDVSPKKVKNLSRFGIFSIQVP